MHHKYAHAPIRLGSGVLVLGKVRKRSQPHSSQEEKTHEIYNETTRVREKKNQKYFHDPLTPEDELRTEDVYFIWLRLLIKRKLSN